MSEPKPSETDSACELCAQDGGELLWRDRHCRVVLVADADYAGFCRVIWGAHIKEMTDLAETERNHCMRVVFAVERAMRSVLNPHKINLASFGNMTPHLHWHVIPRYVDDPHFPQPIWSSPQRAVGEIDRHPSTATLASAISAALE